MKGAFGIPRGFFSSENTALTLGGISKERVGDSNVSFLMSRLIVKNLPSYVTPAKLQEHFEQKKGPGGTLTDVKVSSKPDGTSRCFGFVGYKSNQEALAAQNWFDQTFIDSTRISVNVIEV